MIAQFRLQLIRYIIRRHRKFRPNVIFLNKKNNNKILGNVHAFDPNMYDEEDGKKANGAEFSKIGIGNKNGSS